MVSPDKFLNKYIFILVILCAALTYPIYGEVFSKPVKTAITTEDIFLLPQDSAYIPRNKFTGISIGMPDSIPGKFIINNPFVNINDLKITLNNISYSHSEDTVNFFTLTPEISEDGRNIDFKLVNLPDTGQWVLDIPAGYFEFQPDFIEVEEMPIPKEDLMALKYAGAWHKPGDVWDSIPMFSIHDDDGVDGKIPSCGTTHIPDRTGYFTMLFPLLQSLGVRGNVSMEGWRCGMTADPPEINDNGRIMRRLEKEFGWEMQGHSMEVLGDRSNNWMVDSLTSPLADIILREASGTGFNNATTSVYDAQTATQYYPSDDRSRWIESPQRFIKPYAFDYLTKQPVMYIKQHDVEYHWGRWFRLAEEWGFKAKSWVQHNAITSHEYAREILRFAPYGFSDLVLPEQYNLPPMRSTATRMLVEGQSAPGYIGEMSDDNSYDHDQFRWFCNYIDKCVEDKGWIVLGLHAYRKCWKNHIPGALVSEGGEYPDEWVDPLKGIDFLNDPLDTPPARLGITDWSEWYPCPGSRLEMLRDLILYCLDKGMMNVISSEGFEKMGNRCAAGYFNNGFRCGYDRNRLVDDRDIYPHYVESATGEESYYNPLHNRNINLSFTITEPEHEYPASMVSGSLPVIYISTENEEALDYDDMELSARFQLKEIYDSDSSEENDNKDYNLILTYYDVFNDIVKKSYNLNFDESVSLLNQSENRHYTLLSNFGSYHKWLGQELGFELSRNLGMSWTPRMIPVEVVLNGNYEGVYFLCESVEISNGRLDILKQENGEIEYEKIPYGWLLEINDTACENQISILEKENGPLIVFSPKSPHSLSENQQEWIENELQYINSVLYSDSLDNNELNNIFDIESFVKYFIIREILNDYKGYSKSFHIYRNDETHPLWTAGPVWDLTMDRISKSDYLPFDPSFPSWSAPHWFGQFMKYPEFEESFKRIWSDFYNTDNLESLQNYLISYGGHLQPAFDANNIRWEEEKYDIYNNYTALDADRSIKTITEGLLNNTKWINEHQDLVAYTEDPEGETTHVNSCTTNTTFRYNNFKVSCLDNGFIDGSLKLVSMDGKIVKSGNGNEISISDLTTGIYLVTAQINDTVVSTKIMQK